MAESVTTIQPRFAGHETFTLRYGWLKKAVHAVCETLIISPTCTRPPLGAGF